MAKRRPLRHSEARRRAEERAQRRSEPARKGRLSALVFAVFATGLLVGVGLGVVLNLSDSLPTQLQVLADRVAGGGADTADPPTSEPSAQLATEPGLAEPSQDGPSSDDVAVALPADSPERSATGSQDREGAAAAEPEPSASPAPVTAPAKLTEAAETPVSSEVLDAETAIARGLPAAPLPPDLARSVEEAAASALEKVNAQVAEADRRPAAVPPPPPSPQRRTGAGDPPASRVHVVYEEVEPTAPDTGRPVNLAALVERAKSQPGMTAPAPRREGQRRGGQRRGGQPVWLANAVPAGEAAGRPMVAIVFDDLGLNRPNARRVIALPGPLTLSFMTYADDLDAMTASARAAGHELLVHMPMEPIDDSLDAGRNVLSVALDTDEVRRRLEWGLGRFSGYVGINNHMGSRFTAYPSGMAVVMAELKRRGLLFLDSKTAVSSVGGRLADRLGVPFIERDIFIDNAPDDPESMRRQLGRLETLARQRGAAVGIGHPHSATIDVLASWLAGLSDRGFVLVPISALVQRRIRLAEESDNAG